MFGIDGPELLVIIIVLIVVIGPKDLPRMMRAFGRATARLRMTAQEFREQFDEAMREADMHDVADSFHDVRKLDPRQNLKQIFEPIRAAAQNTGRHADAAAPPQGEAVPEPEQAAAVMTDGAEAVAEKKTAEAVMKKAEEQQIAATGREGSGRDSTR